MPTRRKISLFRLCGDACAAEGSLSMPSKRSLGRRIERVNLSPAGSRRPGVDLSAADKAIELPVERGFELVGVLGGLPYEFDGREGTSNEAAVFNPLDDLDAYELYVEHVAAHFRGRIDTWESWHEPNRTSSWGRSPSAKDYVAVLRAQRRALARVNPEATLLLAATDDCDLAYLREVLGELAGERAFDAVALHPYRWSELSTEDLRELPLEDGLSTAQMSWRDELLAVGRLFHLYRYGTPDMLVTEVGWGKRDEELRPLSMLSLGRRSHHDEVERDAAHVEQTYNLLRSDAALDFVKSALWFDIDGTQGDRDALVPPPSRRFRPRSTLASGSTESVDLVERQPAT